jgi:hypothetical protein
MTKEEAEALTKENAALKKQLAAKKATSAQGVAAIDAFEKQFKPLIVAKIKAGLTREQAVEVIRAQIKEDPQVAEAQLQEVSK